MTAERDSACTVAADIAIEAGEWPAESDLRALSERSLEAACAVALADDSARVGGELEVSLVFTDDAAMRELNRKWRGKDSPTNVLSFPQPPVPHAPIGDIVLGFETVKREAGLAGKPLEAHISHLVVHGFLHLLGYDHEIPEDAEHMERLEREGLSMIGIADPYSVTARVDD
ncbi:MAG TPA: rRNA maturation RNase YbeY [Afifellaceae bacterium]|nr:rRNA maturation RNase YbeY [Afifellaceae bacterium]